MRATTSIILGTLAAALIGPAASGESRDRVLPRDEKVMDQWLAGKQPGRPVDCISDRMIRSTYYVGERTILYRINSKLVYRNDPPGGCLGLSSSGALITRTPTGQLCRGDIAQVHDFGTHISGGSCALGAFVPYTPAR